MGRYVDPSDLVGQVVRAVEADIDQEEWARAPVAPPVAANAGAQLEWEHVHRREPRGLDKNGRMKYNTTANDLVVRNTGSVAAEELTFEVAPVGGTRFIFHDAPTEPITVHPHSSVSWTLIPTPSMGSSGSTVEISAQWTEIGESRAATRTITLSGG
jgi:hypothetical protein